MKLCLCMCFVNIVSLELLFDCDFASVIVCQEGTGKFNRAKLLNVGYVEALKDDNYDCFVFSDVDLIPIDDRNTYKCFSNPRHLSAAMDKFGFKSVSGLCLCMFLSTSAEHTQIFRFLSPQSSSGGALPVMCLNSADKDTVDTSPSALLLISCFLFVGKNTHALKIHKIAFDFVHWKNYFVFIGLKLTQLCRFLFL